MDADELFDATTRSKGGWLYATVVYGQRNGTIALQLPIVVEGGDGWQDRAETTARIVGELHFALYDFDHGGS